LEKERKKEQAQHPPSLHGRSDTPNYWKERRRKKKEPIVSLSEKSDQPNSGKRKKKKKKALQPPFMEDQSNPYSGGKKTCQRKRKKLRERGRRRRRRGRGRGRRRKSVPLSKVSCKNFLVISLSDSQIDPRAVSHATANFSFPDRKHTREVFKQLLEVNKFESQLAVL